MNIDQVCFVLQILCIFIKSSFSLYEDQIGKFDWKHQHIGKSSKVLFDTGVSSTKKIVVATEENVVAVLNPRNGEILWRHVFEQTERGRIDDIFLQNDNVVVVTGGGALVRCFTGTLGQLKWEDSFYPKEFHSRGVITAVNDKSIIVQASGQVRQYSTVSGHKRWAINLPNRAADRHIRAVVQGDTAMSVALVLDSHVELTTIKTSSEGKNPEVQDTQKIAAGSFMHATTDCRVLESNIIFCLEPRTASVYIANLSASSISFKAYHLQSLGLHHIDVHLQILDTLKDNVLIQLARKGLVIVQAGAEGLTMVRNLKDMEMAQLVNYNDKNIVVTIAMETDGLGDLEAVDLETGMKLNELAVKINIAAHHGGLDKLLCFSYKTRQGTVALRYLLLSEDHSILMLQPSGRMAWLREEGLARVLSAQMVDLPVSPILAKMEDEFGKGNGGLISMFKRRFQTQILQLKEFIQYMLRLATKVHQQHDDLEDDMMDVQDEYYLTRDEFNLHKMIVVVTEAGKIYGIDSTTGSAIWKAFLPGVTPFNSFGQSSMPLFTQRTTAHFPHAPKSTLVAKLKGGKGVILYSFNPITGEIVEGPIKLPFTVRQVTMVTAMTADFIHPLLLLDNKNQYHVYPEEAEALVAASASSIFLYTADADTGIVSGYNVVVEHEGLHASELWRVDTLRSAGQKITALVGKPPSEQVHSPGVVLGNRNVLYKYINPNLVVLITESEVSTSNSALMVYLMDSVTGHLVRVFQQKRCSGPVRVVHSEHWVVYSYWSHRHRRTEVTVIEMYEGQRQTNSTAFSSLHTPVEPIVERQAFVINAHVTAMATTYTEKGLTNKYILLGLANGGILGLPKLFIDARRPISPTEYTREEGLIPYEPELPRPSELFINYNQSVFNIQHIYSAPAGLESTSLVLAYGLDMFFTRVMPSKMFDVLKDDFDYFLISVVLGGMIMASIVARKIAANKMLRRAWK